MALIFRPSKLVKKLIKINRYTTINNISFKTRKKDKESYLKEYFVLKHCEKRYKAIRVTELCRFEF